jgi:hypothetical protein
MAAEICQNTVQSHMDHGPKPPTLDVERAGRSSSDSSITSTSRSSIRARRANRPASLRVSTDLNARSRQILTAVRLSIPGFGSISSGATSPTKGFIYEKADSENLASTPLNPKTLRRRALRQLRSGHDWVADYPLECNSLGILEELNQSYARHSRPWRKSIPIFQDETAGPDETEQVHTPTRVDFENMKTLATSPSPRTPSPIGKTKRARQRRDASRKVTFDALRYIEHLESQISNLQNEVQYKTSPGGPESTAAKLRAMSAETQNLKEEVSNWEQRFRERVKQEVESRQELDIALKARLRSLERDAEVYSVKTKDLEAELDRLQRRAKRLEGADAATIDLNKRIDNMTELLASSQKKEYQTTTPVPRSARKPRPRSMLALVSPTKTKYVPDASLDQALGSSAEGSTFGDDDTNDAQKEPTQRRGYMSMDMESILGERGPASDDSAYRSMSRRGSMMSQAGTGQSWGTSPGDSPLKRSESNRRRTMRRFPCGSTQLRPLILPTSSFIHSNPHSAPGLDENSPNEHSNRNSFSENLPAREWNDGNESSEEDRAKSRAESLAALEGNPKPRINSHSVPEVVTPEPSTGLGILDFGPHIGNSTEIAFPNSLTPPPSEMGDKRLSLIRQISSPVTNTERAIATFQQGGSWGSPTVGSVASLYAMLRNMWRDPLILARRLVMVGNNSGAGLRTNMQQMALWYLGFLFRSKKNQQQQRLVEQTRTGDRLRPVSARGSIDWHSFQHTPTSATYPAERNASNWHSMNSRRSGGSFFSPSAEQYSGTGGQMLNLRNAGSQMMLTSRSRPAGQQEHHAEGETSEKPSRVWLWLKFSVAIVMAVGVAVRHGPEAVLITADNGEEQHQQHGQSQNQNQRLRIEDGMFSAPGPSNDTSTDKLAQEIVDRRERRLSFRPSRPNSRAFVPIPLAIREAGAEELESDMGDADISSSSSPAIDTTAIATTAA